MMRYIFLATVSISLMACGVGSGSSDETGSYASGNEGGQNSSPTADAGPDQTADVGATVTLDGSESSDPDGDTLTYSWSIDTQPSESTASFSDATVARPSLTLDEVGEYRIQLSVSDGNGGTAEDSVLVTASPTNNPPTANAGDDQNVVTGNEVSLDGSLSSDSDGDLITYSWLLLTIPEGSSATLSDSGIVNPTFVADLDGQYIAELTVSDGTSSSAADSVTITAATANSIPVADAGGDQNVAPNTLVILDGSGSSDADGDGLTYLWSLTSVPEGSAAELDDSTLVGPSFTADLVGTYSSTLTVNDGFEDSAPDSVTITVATPNSVPIANAGLDQEASTCEQITLDGSASTDADGDPLSYVWSFNSIPDGSGSQILDSNTVSSRFVADVAGSYVVNLIVSDESSTSEPDTVSVNVSTEPDNGGPALRLFEQVDSALEARCLPYISAGESEIITAGFNCTVATFQLRAEGGTFTVTNVSAGSADPDVEVSFSGLANDQLISENSAVNFSLKSSDTGGVVAVEYVFQILETNQTFNLNRELNCDTPE